MKNKKSSAFHIEKQEKLRHGEENDGNSGPRPSRGSGKASLVNWEPWSVLNISGTP